MTNVYPVEERYKGIAVVLMDTRKYQSKPNRDDLVSKKANEGLPNGWKSNADFPWHSVAYAVIHFAYYTRWRLLANDKQHPFSGR